ncbi:MAG: hypothetical protein ACJAS1_005315 [Oleiphilaceae bacterium]|jgi:hypothetical protein
MKNLFIGIIAIILSNGVFAYDGSPKENVKDFFKDFSKNSDTAIDNLYSSNPLMQQKIQALTVMKTQTKSLSNFYGKFIGYELITEEKISPSLTRISAIGKYTNHPVTWEFYFYKPNKKWMTSQAVVVDQFQNIGSKK